ncbi:MAG: glutathione peroxidase [Actinomycetaceae bacterium]|nr:glutathione peroxidase [Actinomycetaceae bacterium]
MGSQELTLRDFQARTSEGELVNLGTYHGQVVLIVNTATRCGLAHQFATLQQLYERYADAGFALLAFPCNQFGEQEPNPDDEVLEICRKRLKLTFPIMEKIDVNGPHATALFQWLRQETGGILGDAIKWNFTKFLIDRSGQVVRRFAPTTPPELIVPDIERLLSGSRYKQD